MRNQQGSAASQSPSKSEENPLERQKPAPHTAGSPEESRSGLDSGLDGPHVSHQAAALFSLTIVSVEACHMISLLPVLSEAFFHLLDLDLCFFLLLFIYRSVSCLHIMVC